ncbi:hypothetical protein [Actinomadura chokoriensis]|uniref:hypothetical protein n=1 Tax=Actinomadura chokoriensis TaxID=454156 RepID=UPI0031F814F6
MSALEDRYRRLLACYPADHRAEHEDEMLDVLMAGARPGQARPSLADTADLLYGAVRIRVRRAARGGTGSPWPGALAAAGFLAMLVIVGDGLRFLLNVPHSAAVIAELLDEGVPLPGQLAHHFGTAPYWLAWAVIAALAWRGPRRLAARAACAVTGAQAVLVLYGTTLPDAPGAWRVVALTSVLPLALLATASLVASPGPRHGARLLGRARVALVTAMAAVVVPVMSALLFTLVHQGDLGPMRFDDVHGLVAFSQNWQWLRFGLVLAAAVVGAAALARTRQGRRACALVATAGAPLLIAVSPYHPGVTGDLPATAVLLAKCLLGFALPMLVVRLAELPTRRRLPT